jgi:hypothetical protein
MSKPAEVAVPVMVPSVQLVIALPSEILPFVIASPRMPLMAYVPKAVIVRKCGGAGVRYIPAPVGETTHVQTVVASSVRLFRTQRRRCDRSKQDRDSDPLKGMRLVPIVFRGHDVNR